jgi:hypothetical protein
MASTHIEIPTTSRLGAQLRAMIDQSRQVHEVADAMYNVMVQYGGDYASMATDFGFTGVNAAANAQTVYGLVAGAWNASYNEADLMALINNCG